MRTACFMTSRLLLIARERNMSNILRQDTNDRFVIGMIGAGEGHQAHGWGLYFAAERHISEAYKTWLEHMPKVHTKTDTYTLDQDGYRVLEKSGARFEDGSPVDQAVAR